MEIILRECSQEEPKEVREAREGRRREADFSLTRLPQVTREWEWHWRIVLPWDKEAKIFCFHIVQSTIGHVCPPPWEGNTISHFPDISEWNAQQFFKKESVSHRWPRHLETGWWVHWCEHGDLGRIPPTSSTRVISILQILTSVCETPSCAEEALAWTPREVTAANVLLAISCPPTSQHVLVRRKTSGHLLVVSHSSHVSARVWSWWLDVCYSYFLHRHQRVWTECEPLS